MVDFETPVLKEYPIIPLIQPGVMAHSKPYVAKPDIQEKIGFPEELVENWQDLQATRISHFDLGLTPRQLIEIDLADGQALEFLLMSEDPEIVIAHPNIGLQYHFRSHYYDQLISISGDDDAS